MVPSPSSSSMPRVGRSRSLIWLAVLAAAACCIAASITLHAEAHGGGAGESCCDAVGDAHQKPKHHNANWQTTPAPYRVVLGASNYTSGTKVAVTLETTDENGFTGFLISAFDEETGLVRFGTFEATGDTLPAEVRFACLASPHGRALTQTSKAVRMSRSFLWTPPATHGSGPVIFTVSVVRTTIVFWKLSSVVLLEVVPAQIIPKNPSEVQVINALIQPDGNSTLTFSFLAPTEQGDIEFYALEQRNSTGFFEVMGTVNVVSGLTLYSGLQIVNLTADTLFTFRVRSSSTSHDFGPATDTFNTIDFTTGHAGGSLPDVPTVPQGTKVLSMRTGGDLGARLVFDLTRFKAQSGVFGYSIEYGENGFSGANFANLTTTSFVVTDLVLGRYSFRIRALSPNGASDYSTEFTYQVVSFCANGCSGQGTCMLPDEVCNCEYGFLGQDCSHPSRIGRGANHAAASTGPLCVGTDCSYLIDFGTPMEDPQQIYFRLTVRTKGWVGLLFDAPDGMTGGTGYYFNHHAGVTATDPGTSSMLTIYAPRRDAPQPANPSIHDDELESTLESWQNATHTEFTFTKTMATMPAILFESGESQHIAWGFGHTQDYSIHADSDRGKFLLNFYDGIFEAAGTIELGHFYAPLAGAVLALILTGIAFQLPLMRYSSLGLGLFQKKLGTWRGNNGISFLNRITLDLLPTIADLMYAELVVALVYCGAVAAFVYLGMREFERIGYDGTFVWAHVTAVHWAFVMFPVQKNSVLNWLLGTSFERMVKYHRMLARLALAYTYVHAATMMWKQGLRTPIDRVDSRWGLYALCAFTATTVVAYEPIRRRWYAAFVVVHATMAPLGYIFAMLHHKYVYWYVPVPLGFWVLDMALRMVIRPFFIHEVTTVDASLIEPTDFNVSLVPGVGTVSKLTLDVSAFPKDFEPGSYCFLNIPAVSRTTFHPFSISSYPDPHAQAKGSSDTTRLTFHILDAGNHFAHGVAQHLKTLGDNPSKQLKVRVDGPYGRLQVELTRYRTIVLVAGGIGVTPMLNILDFLTQKINSGLVAYAGIASIHLIFGSRVPSAFTKWAPELIARVQSMKIVKLHFFLNGPSTSPVLPTSTAASVQPASQQASNDATLSSINAFSLTRDASVDRPADFTVSSRNAEHIRHHVRVHLATEADEVAAAESTAPNAAFAESLVVPVPNDQPSVTLLVPPTIGFPNFPALFEVIAEESESVLASSLPEEFVAHRSGNIAHSVVVLACGPPVMVAQAQAQALSHEFHFHKESFAL